MPLSVSIGRKLVTDWGLCNVLEMCSRTEGKTLTYKTYPNRASSSKAAFPMLTNDHLLPLELKLCLFVLLAGAVLDLHSAALKVVRLGCCGKGGRTVKRWLPTLSGTRQREKARELGNEEVARDRTVTSEPLHSAQPAWSCQSLAYTTGRSEPVKAHRFGTYTRSARVVPS